MDLKFQKYELPKDAQISGADEFFEQVRKATAEAMRRGIKANSLVINKNMVYVPEACGMDLKMVCGLHCYVTKDELPEEYSFAVLHDPTREKKDVVAHGRWDNECRCTACGWYGEDWYKRDVYHFDYCPNCGAKMDKEEDE